MLAVAVVALYLAGLKGLLFVAGIHPAAFSKTDSLESSVLSPGRVVVLQTDCDSMSFRGRWPSSPQDFYNLKREAEVGPVPIFQILAGTRAVIVVDPGDDDATAYRSIAIKLIEGQHEGSIVAVPRGSVRKL